MSPQNFAKSWKVVKYVKWFHGIFDKIPANHLTTQLFFLESADILRDKRIYKYFKEFFWILKDMEIWQINVGKKLLY